jgi:LacI family transcriptional regulator
MDTGRNEKTLNLTCPYCKGQERQVKAGIHQDIQRYKCGICQRRYTLEQRRDYPESLRQQAMALQAEGKTLREIARQLEVSPQTISNWFQRVPSPQSPLSPPSLRVLASETYSSEVSGEKKRPTIREVARCAHVSTSTVSNFLNGRQRMGEKTRQRIEAAIEELNFTPSALVRAIRHRRTGIIGVLLWGINTLDRDVGQSLAPPLLAGISSAADTAEYDILLYTGWPDRPLRHPGLQFLNGHIDGLIWVDPGLGEPVLERVAVAGLPVVAALTRHVPEGVGYIQTDNVAAIAMVVRHLAEQGHRRIAFAGPVHSSDFLDRREGYRRGLAAVGLPFDPALETIVSVTRWTMEAYGTVLTDWMALPVPPTAVAMPNDGLAVMMIALARERGLRVPEDIAITGFDDMPDAERLGGGLTTIHQPFRQIGETAVQRLLAMIEGVPAKDCRVQLPGELIIRASTMLTNPSPSAG